MKNQNLLKLLILFLIISIPIIASANDMNASMQAFILKSLKSTYQQVAIIIAKLIIAMWAVFATIGWMKLKKSGFKKTFIYLSINMVIGLALTAGIVWQFEHIPVTAFHILGIIEIFAPIVILYWMMKINNKKFWILY